MPELKSASMILKHVAGLACLRIVNPEGHHKLAL
jgi:hypothetical protein